jgi:hypothetical protein
MRGTASGVYRALTASAPAMIEGFRLALRCVTLQFALDLGSRVTGREGGYDSALTVHAR